MKGCNRGGNAVQMDDGNEVLTKMMIVYDGERNRLEEGRNRA